MQSILYFCGQEGLICKITGIVLKDNLDNYNRQL